jgi:methylenetetrahydrofolate reductase (NADPH)
VAGYSEKHFEAPNLSTDVRYAKAKVDAGAEYVVTQMFFDNRHYFRFVETCREQGIGVPIIPGLKVLGAAKQLTTIPRNFFVEIPRELSDEVTASPAHATEIGARWAQRQVEELLGHGVPAVHFYLMQSATPVKLVMDRLQL